MSLWTTKFFYVTFGPTHWLNYWTTIFSEKMTVYIAAATHLHKLWFARVREREETASTTEWEKTSVASALTDPGALIIVASCFWLCEMGFDLCHVSFSASAGKLHPRKWTPSVFDAASQSFYLPKYAAPPEAPIFTTIFPSPTTCPVWPRFHSNRGYVSRLVCEQMDEWDHNPNAADNWHSRHARELFSHPATTCHSNKCALTTLRGNIVFPILKSWSHLDSCSGKCSLLK